MGAQKIDWLCASQTPFSETIQFQDRCGFTVSSTVAGNPTTINTTEPHGLKAGESVVIVLRKSDGCQVVSYESPYAATINSDTQFTIPLDTSNQGSLTGEGHVPKDLTGLIFSGTVYDGHQLAISGTSATGTTNDRTVKVKLPRSAAAGFEEGGSITIGENSYAVLSSSPCCERGSHDGCVSVNLVLGSPLLASVSAAGWSGYYLRHGMKGSAAATITGIPDNTNGSVRITSDLTSLKPTRSYFYEIYQTSGVRTDRIVNGTIAFNNEAGTGNAVKVATVTNPVVFADPSSISNVSLTINTVAELAALPDAALPDGTIRELSGYYAANDREMGRYILMPANGLTELYGIRVAAPSGRLWYLLKTEINSDYFGTQNADDFPTFDNRQRFEDCVNYAFATNQPVTFAPRKYHLNAPMLVESDITEARARVIWAYGTEFDHAIWFGNCRGVVAYGLAFNNTPSEGVRMARCQNGGLIDCTFTNIGTHGIRFMPVSRAAQGASANAQITNGRFENLTFNECNQWAMQFIGAATANRSWVNANNFYKITVRNTAGGIQYVGGTGPVGGSQFNYNGFYGLQTETDVAGLSIDASEDDANDIRFRQNSFHGCHLSSEAAIGVNAINSTVRMLGPFNSIVGGRIRHYAWLDDESMYWFNSGFTGHAASGLPSDNGIRANMPGVDLASIVDTLTVSNNLVTGKGFSLTQTPIINVAADQRTNHTIDFNLAAMPASTAATIRVSLTGHQSLASVAGAGNKALGEVLIYCTREAGGAYDVQGIELGSSATLSLNSIGLGGANNARINLTTSVNIASWTAIPEVKTSDGTILD